MFTTFNTRIDCDCGGVTTAFTLWVSLSGTHLVAYCEGCQAKLPLGPFTTELLESANSRLDNHE